MTSSNISEQNSFFENMKRELSEQATQLPSINELEKLEVSFEEYLGNHWKSKMDTILANASLNKEVEYSDKLPLNDLLQSAHYSYAYSYTCMLINKKDLKSIHQALFMKQHAYVQKAALDAILDIDQEEVEEGEMLSPETIFKYISAQHSEQNRLIELCAVVLSMGDRYELQYENVLMLAHCTLRQIEKDECI